jgi:hypothetical protein
VLFVKWQIWRGNFSPRPAPTTIIQHLFYFGRRNRTALSRLKLDSVPHKPFDRSRTRPLCKCHSCECLASVEDARMSTIYNNGWTLSSDIAAGDSRLHPGCCCVPSRYQAHERSLALRLRLGAVVSFLQGRSPKRALGVLRRDQAAFRPPTTTLSSRLRLPSWAITAPHVYSATAIKLCSLPYCWSQATAALRSSVQRGTYCCQSSGLPQVA